MKNISRNKFLKCFRPVVNMDHLMLDSKAVLVDRSQKHQALKYVGVKEEEEDIMKPSTSTNKSSVSDAEESHHRAGKKRFSQVIKAVFFEILLAKRVRDRKGIDQGSYSSKHDFPLSRHDKLLDTSVGKSVNNNVLDISRSNSVSSISSSLSSSSSSSSSPNSTQLQSNNSSHHQERKRKPKQERKDRGSSSYSAMLLLLICLALTIFGGKTCAILFTSIWLYFIHLQQSKAVYRKPGKH